MNVCEATATNLLLGAVLGMSAVGAVPVSDEDAERAAHFLGNRAYKALDEELDGEAVAARWARRFHSGIPVCERCREVRDAAARCDGCGDALCLRCWGDGDKLFCAACWLRRQPAFEDVVVTNEVL
jgi:primosomal protein N'